LLKNGNRFSRVGRKRPILKNSNPGYDFGGETGFHVIVEEEIRYSTAYFQNPAINALSRDQLGEEIRVTPEKRL